MKKIAILLAGAALVCSVIFASCEFGTIREVVGGLKYSIQVNNQSASRSISAADTVELYIYNFEYCEDANNRGLIIIANGDRDMGSRGGVLNNAGWYSVTSDLAVSNDVNNGPYSGFEIGISKLRVNGTEYDFPTSYPDTVFFGSPTAIWIRQGPRPQYPDNFSGITITDSVHSLKTVLTVNPDILDAGGNLVSDPYRYIKVEGRINE
jgi:hypothetical protein